MKEISKFFGVSIDELLSGDEVITIAEKEKKDTENRFLDLIFGLLDISVAILVFLPFFGYRVDGIVREVSLLSLEGIQTYLKIAYIAIFALIIFWGILILASQRTDNALIIKYKYRISIILYAVAALLFILSSQPYAAVFFFIFHLTKIMILGKKG